MWGNPQNSVTVKVLRFLAKIFQYYQYVRFHYVQISLQRTPHWGGVLLATTLEISHKGPWEYLTNS